jgi:hypothetical protein
VKRIALVVLAGAVAASIVVVSSREPALSAGPVNAGAGGTGYAQPIEVGAQYSIGYLLKNYGKEPAVLEKIRILGVTGPIEVLGVLARPRPSGSDFTTFLAASGFPPTDYPSRSLAEEHVVPVPAPHSADEDPIEALQLAVGVKSTGLGVGKIRGIEFTYRVSGRRYRNSFEGNGFLCAPAALYATGGAKDDECLGPRTDRTFDEKVVDFRVPVDEHRAG